MSGARIPVELQRVFTASLNGSEVHRPPPERLAFRTFSTRELGSSSKTTASQTSSSKCPGAELADKNDNHQQHNGSFGTPSERPTFNRSDSIASAPCDMSEDTIYIEDKKRKHNPQLFLESILKERGYNTRKFSTLQTAYRNHPTNLQTACFHSFFLDMIMDQPLNTHEKSRNLEAIKAILECGVTPNACNCMGETLVHFLCRSGQKEHVAVLQLLFKFKASVQVSDDRGRTPLHEACLRQRKPEKPRRRQQVSSNRGKSDAKEAEPQQQALPPCFAIVEMIVKKDAGLFFMKDANGKTPLSCVAEEYWPLWIQYLDSHKEKFWPLYRNSVATTASGMASPALVTVGTTTTVRKIPPQIRIPRLAALAPKKRPLPIPSPYLSTRQAAKIVSGVLKPHEHKKALTAAATLLANSSSVKKTEINRRLKRYNKEDGLPLEPHRRENDVKPTRSSTTLLDHSERDDSMDEDSIIGCWIKPSDSRSNSSPMVGDGSRTSGSENDDDHYADSIILGGVPVPTLRYALVNEDYVYQSGAESVAMSRRGSGASSVCTFNRRLSETSYTSSVGCDQKPFQKSFSSQQSQQSQTQQLGGEATYESGACLVQHLGALPTQSQIPEDAGSLSSGEATSQFAMPYGLQNHGMKSLLDESKKLEAKLSFHKPVGNPTENGDKPEDLHHRQPLKEKQQHQQQQQQPMTTPSKPNAATTEQLRTPERTSRRSSLDFPGHEWTEDNDMHGAGASLDLSNLIVMFDVEGNHHNRNDNVAQPPTPQQRQTQEPASLDELDDEEEKEEPEKGQETEEEEETERGKPSKIHHNASRTTVTTSAATTNPVGPTCHDLHESTQTHMWFL